MRANTRIQWYRRHCALVIVCVCVSPSMWCECQLHCMTITVQVCTVLVHYTITSPSVCISVAGCARPFECACPRIRMTSTAKCTALGMASGDNLHVISNSSQYTRQPPISSTCVKRVPCFVTGFIAISVVVPAFKKYIWKHNKTQICTRMLCVFAINNKRHPSNGMTRR